MTYDETTARQLVIEAGHRLLEKKLTARTWGNISARISDTQFVITPSGRAYEDLKPEELVVVTIADGSWSGGIRPSSEKGVHAAAYAARRYVNFVIHTHQFYASAVAAEGRSLDFAPCARYGEAGSPALAANLEAVIRRYPEDKTFLMTKHGALLLGSSCEDAFALAETLEEDCRRLVDARVGRVDYVQSFAAGGRLLRAWIDDFAQIVGPAASLKNGVDALCAGADEEDAQAIRMITEKNCAAALYARQARPLGLIAAYRKHQDYLNGYSRLKDSNK